ncbi:MAG TPA: insulinase family protein, partial [Pyrinomonadaceae bacterium]|nr:insulinase family protein [Pyrinomonadaceae bacterium]
QDGERSVTVRRAGDFQMVSAAYHIPSINHPDTAPLSILGQMMSASPSGPLYKALVETKKANSASGRPAPNGDPNLFNFSATLSKDQNLDVARQTLLETVENYAKNPVSTEELERAKELIVKNVDNQRADVIMFTGAVLTNYVGQGDWRMYFLFRDRLKQVTAQDIQRVAAKYFVQSNRTVGMFIPTDNPVRAEIEQVNQNDLTAMFKDFKGGEAIESGEAFDPSPTNIEARVKRLKTKSGIELALLPKKNRGEKVNAIVSLFLGNEKALMNRNVAGMVAAGMLVRGSTKYSRQQIQDELNKLKTRAGIGGDSTRSGANIDTTRENLIPALRLAAEVLRNPTFPAEDFEQVRQAYIAGYERQLTEPQRLADEALQKNLNQFPKGDIRAVITPEEMIAQLKALTLDDVKKFYQDFYGAGYAKVAIVGDFDENAVAPVIEELFGGWKSKIPFAPANDAYFDAPAINKAIETPDKANAYFSAAQNIKISDSDSDYPALFMGNYILGGAGLNSRIAIR